MNDSMQSFFAVVGFLFCVFCFAIGFKFIAQVAYMGYQAADFRLQTMAKRVSELRENQLQNPIEFHPRKTG